MMPRLICKLMREKQRPQPLACQTLFAEVERLKTENARLREELRKYQRTKPWWKWW